MGYALGNLFTNYESYDPPSTPAMEVRVVPINHLYVKSMVEAEDRDPYAHNPTGFVAVLGTAAGAFEVIGFLALGGVLRSTARLPIDGKVSLLD